MVWVFLTFSQKKKKTCLFHYVCLRIYWKKYHIFYIKLLTYVNNGVNL